VAKDKHRYRLDVSTKRLVGRLWRDWVRAYAGRLGVGLVLMALTAAGSAAYPKLIGTGIDALEAADMRLVWLMAPVFVVLTFATGLANYFQSVITQSVALRVIADLQRALFRHLMAADLSLFHATATGKLISRFTVDVQLLRDAVSKSFTGMVRDSLMVVFFTAVMFWEDWLLALVVFLVFPATVVPIVRIGRRLRRVSTNFQQVVGDLTALLNEAFDGIRLVKTYRMEGRLADNTGAVVDEARDLTIKAARGRSRMYPIMETLAGIAVALAFVVGALRIQSGVTSLGSYVTFIAALIMAYRPMRSLGNLNASLQEGLAAAERLFALLDTRPSIVDRADAKPLTVTDGAVRLEGVRFAYDAEVPALGGVTLDVPAGKTVALVGPSGAGKSTVYNLIPRFYDVDAGRVTIDGQDVRDVTLASLRDAIALVSQEITLFNDTVRANIAFGRPEADDAAIEEAARAAAADDFIRELPRGYDTIVGDRGVKLSGGQRQRVAIARAMLKDARILLLDEATSALDTESERQVQAALDRLREGRTTLVIAHRLSTVAAADLIYVLDGGRLVESGSHGELKARDGLYARLCRLQFHDAGAIPLAPESARASA